MSIGVADKIRMMKRPEQRQLIWAFGLPLSFVIRASSLESYFRFFESALLLMPVTRKCPLQRC
jgi:hypothetical protein